MTDYTRAVYDYLRTLGDVGDEVFTAIHPYLMKKFDLTPEEARTARAQAMRELNARGMVERRNTRSRYLKILTDFYPDPWKDPNGKFVESGLEAVDSKKSSLLKNDADGPAGASPSLPLRRAARRLRRAPLGPCGFRGRRSRTM